MYPTTLLVQVTIRVSSSVKQPPREPQAIGHRAGAARRVPDPRPPRVNARGIQTDGSKFSGRFTLAQRKVLLNRVDVRPSARLDYCLSQISKSLSYLGLRVATGVHVLGSPPSALALVCWMYIV